MEYIFVPRLEKRVEEYGEKERENGEERTVAITEGGSKGQAFLLESLSEALGWLVAP